MYFYTRADPLVTAVEVGGPTNRAFTGTYPYTNRSAVQLDATQPNEVAVPQRQPNSNAGIPPPRTFPPASQAVVSQAFEWQQQKSALGTTAAVCLAQEKVKAGTSSELPEKPQKANKSPKK